MKGPLKWETDLYIFVRALFNERLRRYDIAPTGVQITWSVNIPEIQQSLFIQESDHDSKEKNDTKEKTAEHKKFYIYYFYQSSQQM